MTHEKESVRDTIDRFSLAFHVINFRNSMVVAHVRPPFLFFFISSSSSHTHHWSRIVKSEKVGPTAQSAEAQTPERSGCLQSFRPSPEKCRRHVGPCSRDFDGVALIARETDRAGHAPLFPEANSNRFEQWPPSMLDMQQELS